MTTQTKTRKPRYRFTKDTLYQQERFDINRNSKTFEIRHRTKIIKKTNFFLWFTICLLLKLCHVAPACFPCALTKRAAIRKKQQYNRAHNTSSFLNFNKVKQNYTSTNYWRSEENLRFVWMLSY